MPLTLSNPGQQATEDPGSASLQMAAHGGTLPYSWTATGLPPHLSINATTGLISGRVGPPNHYTVVVTVKDSANHSAQVEFTWTVVLI